MTDLLPIEGAGPEIPRAPRGLKAEGRKLWREIQTANDFAEAPERSRC